MTKPTKWSLTFDSTDELYETKKHGTVRVSHGWRHEVSEFIDQCKAQNIALAGAAIESELIKIYFPTEADLMAAMVIL